ncbi:unnamed protein product [Zymoseptoria tritici ST99CH_3D1]|uniref:Uncharacterized protein n=1 Tax=Zymoseptoria tritici ST99CH_1E4 TaxID=1276532 RepID=A0A2H1GCG7_ZYMTR|nr:unnamed protein product [Zymoseptoria tritici ST99CH_1E4]SMR52322.1 unnamed protein product [Zymoseptoria tritici ST99CH_3D1]
MMDSMLLHIALFCLLGISAAQIIPTNLTLTFSSSSQGSSNSCADSSSTSGLTFTTSPLPTVGQCFNLADIFTNSTNSSTHNQTYSVTNFETYDPAANYSSIHYSQPNTSTTADATQRAARAVYLYSAADCQQGNVDNNGETLEPYFVWSCQNLGECFEVGIGVKSFVVSSAERGFAGGREECLMAEAVGANGGLKLKGSAAMALMMACAVIVGVGIL